MAADATLREVFQALQEGEVGQSFACRLVHGTVEPSIMIGSQIRQTNLIGLLKGKLI